MVWDISDRLLRCGRCGDEISMYVYRQLKNDVVSQQNYKQRRVYGKTEKEEIGEAGAAEAGKGKGCQGDARAGGCRAEVGR